MILTIHKLYLSWSDATPRPLNEPGQFPYHNRMNGLTPQARHSESLAVADKPPPLAGGTERVQV